MIHQIDINPKTLSYIRENSLREPEILATLRDETLSHKEHTMQISPEQGQFLSLLAKLIGAEKALEIGVFTGYSTLSTAYALPKHGKIYACDIDPNTMAIAREYWTKAKLSDRIIECLGDALATLNRLIREGHEGSFDFIFIDADKINYDSYYEMSLKLLRTGGLIVLDNTLWSGKVSDPEFNDSDTIALRNLNAKLRSDMRVDISLLPFSDGLTLLRKI